MKSLPILSRTHQLKCRKWFFKEVDMMQPAFERYYTFVF